MPFELKEEISGGENLDLFVDVNVNNLVVTSLNQTISIDGEVVVSGYMFDTKEVSDIASIENIEAEEETVDSIKVKVYYKEKNESLWDIGKKNLIAKEDILKINDFESEEDVLESCPLIIK